MILRLVRFAAVSCCRTIVFIMIVLAAARANEQIADGNPEPPYELWKINAAGGEPQRLADTPGYTCGSPDCSPDGKQIAYDTWRIGQTYNDSKIAIIRADGTQSKIIGDGGMPSWSPDGSQLACHTYVSPQTIIVMNADGSGRETIINHWGSPRWLPRGNRIASLGKNRQLFVFDLVDGKERRFVPGQRALSLTVDGQTWSTVYTADIGFGVSPDGQQLCFGDTDGGLFLATLDDRSQTTVRQLTKSFQIRHCSFSPDGKRIVFSGSSTVQDIIDIEAERMKGTVYPREQLFIMDVNSADEPRRLTGQSGKWTNSCPDWSPDGKTIIFVSQQP